MRTRWKAWFSRFAAALACLTLALAIGCGRQKPLLLEPRPDPPQRPVILIPGLSGTKLLDPDKDRTVWGNAGRIVAPRDGGYELALPLSDAERDKQGYVTDGVIKRIDFGITKLDIYGTLIDNFLANGYEAGETFFVFPYDWRYNNVDTARRLANQLEQLRIDRGEETLHVDIICQSNAARIARYFIKYGSASLEQAEAGEARPPTNIIVDHLFLVGTANGGATNGFRNFLEGRSYAPLIGRKFKPETVFTFEAAYETLPAYRTSIFQDEQGNDLELDLFDATTWQQQQWSIYHPKVEKRLNKNKRPDLFEDAAARAEHLERNLNRSKRLHAVLIQDIENYPPTKIVMIQNNERETRDRATLKQNGKILWEPTTEGDGHASIQSQYWLSPQEKAAIVDDPLNIPVYHRLIIRHEQTQRAILERLLRENDE